MMNVFQKSLKQYKEIHIKQCREIKFANGGHMFAAVNTNSINVFNFYTGECTNDYIFKEHKGKVGSVSWFEDDSGFVSAGLDGLIYVWDLHNSNRADYCFKNKGTNFACIEKTPDPVCKIYACGTDKTLREITYEPENDKDEEGKEKSEYMLAKGGGKDQKQTLDAKEKRRYESSCQFAAVVVLKEGRGLIVGTGDNDRPGQISIFRLEALELVFTIQAHSLPITRLQLNFDNSHLFSASKDGSVGIFEIKDS